VTPPYASLEDIRGRGVTEQAAPDEAVQKALDRATRAIDAFAGRDFHKREAVHLVDGNGTESIFLEDRPVVEVLELKVDDYPVPAADFVLYPEAGYVRLDNARPNIFAGFPGVFPVGARNVEVRGFFGFEEVPPEVNEAAILLALEVLRGAPAEADVAAGSAASTRHAIGIRRVRIDEISVDFEYPEGVKAGTGRAPTTGLPKADALLARFRRQLNPVAV